MIELALRFRVWLVGGLAGWNASVDLWGGPRDSDFMDMVAGGERLFSSEWAFAFEDPIIQNGPLTLAWSGTNTIVERVTGVPSQLLFALVVYGGLSLGAMFLVRTLYRDRGEVAPPAIELGVGITAILSGVAWNGVQSGQPVDAIVAILWILVARASLKDRPIQAGVLLAAAAAVKLVAVLGVPLLLLLPGLRRRGIAVAATTVGITACYLPFFVFGEVNTFDYEWSIHTWTIASLVTPPESFFPWHLRLVQATVIVGVGAVITHALRRRPDVVWLAPLAIAVVRIATDPIRVGYYWLAPEVAILVGIAMLFPRLSRRHGTAAVVAFFVMSFAFLVPGLGQVIRYVIAIGAFVVGLLAARRGPNLADGPARV